jgi:hypothetical protein
MSPTSQSATSSTAQAAAPVVPRGPDTVVGAFRLAMAALTAAALITSFVRTLYTHGGEVNFFSYFTNISNILGVAVFVVGGLALLRRGTHVSDYLRGATCLYLMVTGAVYWTLLANTITPVVIPWTNDVVHGVMPAAAIMDWLIAPPGRRLLQSRALYWLVFPLVYLAYSLIRGPIVQWYPYPFLDPRTRGYVHVTLMSIAVTAVFLLFTVLIVAAGNWLRHDPDLSPEV